MNDPAPGRASLERGGFSLRALCWPATRPAGATILLLHATSFCADVWRPVWTAARRSGAVGPAVAPDARGHGLSDASPSPDGCAWSTLVDDIVAWIDTVPTLLPEPADPETGVVLVGHSSGATCALAAAARRPARVRGVLAVEPVLFDPPPAAAEADSYPGSRYMAQQARRRRAAFASVDEARERLASRPSYANFAREAMAAFLEGGLAPVEGGGVSLRCTPEIEAACYEGAAGLDLWPALARIVCPVSVVVGDRGFVPSALLHRLRETLPGMAVETIEGGTHFVVLERPSEVGDSVARFIRDVTVDRVG